MNIVIMIILVQENNTLVTDVSQTSGPQFTNVDMLLKNEQTSIICSMYIVGGVSVHRFPYLNKNDSKMLLAINIGHL